MSAARWSTAGMLLLAGCAVSQPAVPLGSFLAGDIAAVQAFAEREVESGHPANLALVLNVRGQCELLAGDYAAAARTFDQAARIMGSWATSGGEATAAIVGSESSKTWKGDPYEKAMNAFYAAFCWLLQGEPDNARAACKRGILADAEVDDERYQADNALLFWMAGRMSKLLASGDERDFYREADAAHAFALQHGARGDPQPAWRSDPAAGNVVLLFECGLGPEKYADGQQQELARFRSRHQEAVGARAVLAGRDLGRAELILDVDYQARTLGGQAMEGIRKGKAVFKTSAAVAGIVLLDQASRDRGHSRNAQAIVGSALLLASLLTSATADVRYWPTLPATVQVLAASVPPGRHRLEVDFLDARGRVLPAMRRVVDIDVPTSGESWHLFRSLPPPTRAANMP